MKNNRMSEDGIIITVGMISFAAIMITFLIIMGGK